MKKKLGKLEILWMIFEKLPKKRFVTLENILQNSIRYFRTWEKILENYEEIFGKLFGNEVKEIC